MNKIRCLLLVLAGWLAGCQPAPDPARITAANYLTAIPDPKTLGETYVSDPDTVLAPATVAALNQRLDSLDRSRRAHLDVVVVRSIGEEVPKMAAYRLFNKWKIGDAQLDNGLLLLLVLDQHRVEFETGRGLEGDLPDAICYRIQQRHMVAPARAGNYDQAVRQGVAALIRQLRPPGAAPAAVPDSVKRRQLLDTLLHGQGARQLRAMQQLADSDSLLPIDAPGSSEVPGAVEPGFSGPLAWLVLGLTLLLSVLVGARTTGGWGIIGAAVVVGGLLLTAMTTNWPPTLGQFAGICYGLAALYLAGYFAWLWWREQPAATPAGQLAEYQRRTRVHAGLGWLAWLFPVPLAAAWWWQQRRLHQLRHPPTLPCPTCGQPLTEQTGEAAAAHLSPGQQVEAKLASVTYDVWTCAAGHALTPAYPNPDSPALNCPACHFRTLLPHRRQLVQAATRRTAGWGWDIARCAFCQHERQRKFTVARLEIPSSSSGSSGSGSSSSWGSSSDSSSSTSSTSSGGSSGGGGAGSSW